MAYFNLSETNHSGKTIMIFLEGTILKPKSKWFLFSFQNYVPIGRCVDIIKRWYAQGMNICYCTSRKRRGTAVMIDLLKRFELPGERLYYRGKGESYKHIVETVKPDVLIEDNCKSIGGAAQMCITHVCPEIRQGIKSVVVKEYKGIDHLAEMTF